MSKTLASRKQNFKLIQDIADLKKNFDEIRSNQSVSLIFVNMTLDGAGTNGQLQFGSGVTMVYLQMKTGGGIDIYNGSNIKIASLDTSGNLKLKGTLTQNTTP